MRYICGEGRIRCIGNVPSGMGLYLVLLFYGTVLAHKLNALLTATAALAAFSAEGHFFFFLALLSHRSHSFLLSSLYFYELIINNK